MQPGEPGIRVAVGASGAGKTYGMRTAIFEAARRHPVMVIDRMREWNAVPADLARYTATKGIVSVEHGAHAAKNGARLIIVRAPANDFEQADAACKWACEYPGIAGVAVPEAHNEMPNGPRLTQHISDVATAWRHHNVALYLDTQRFAQLSPSVRDLSREMRLYAMTGKADLNACDEIHPSIRGHVIEAARRLAPIADGGMGEPGWHVRLGLVRVPPYHLIRGL